MGNRLRLSCVEIVSLAGLLLSAATPAVAWAQAAPAPFHVITRNTDLAGARGAFSVLAADSPREIHLPEAVWVMLEFEAFHLGRSGRLTILDLESGDSQTFG